MVRADFYILQHTILDLYQRVACKLITKAYSQAKSVFILCESEKDAYALDQLLWTYQEGSFIPHLLVKEAQNYKESIPIQIGYDLDHNPIGDIFLNLTQNFLLDETHGFSRIIELVPNNKNYQTQSRIRYRTYRERNYELHTHKL